MVDDGVRTFLQALIVVAAGAGVTVSVVLMWHAGRWARSTQATTSRGRGLARGAILIAMAALLVADSTPAARTEAAVLVGTAGPASIIVPLGTTARGPSCHSCSVCTRSKPSAISCASSQLPATPASYVTVGDNQGG